MPNARGHRAITIFAQFLTFPAGIWALSAGFGKEFACFQAGILITYFVNPDADLHQKLGPVGAVIGLEDYEDAMPHRYGLSLSHWRNNPWKAMLGSHAPISGTLLRGFVVLLPIILSSIVIASHYGVPSSMDIVKMSSSILVGMIYSDLWHLGADLVTTKWKRWWRGRKRSGVRSRTRRVDGPGA